MRVAGWFVRYVFAGVVGFALSFAGAGADSFAAALSFDEPPDVSPDFSPPDDSLEGGLFRL